MKKYLLSAACLAVLSTPAHAAPATLQDYFEFHPYVGADYQHSEYSYNDSYTGIPGLTLTGDDLLKKALEGGDLHIGNRFNKFLGVELGYFYNAAAKKSVAAGSAVGPGVVAATNLSTTVKTQGATLDALGYLPLGPAEKFDLIGTAGVTRTQAKATLGAFGASSSVDNTEWGWRAGGGLQLHLTSQINLRGLVRYQSADFKDIADHAVVYSVGLNYEF